MMASLTLLGTATQSQALSTTDVVQIIVAVCTLSLAVVTAFMVRAANRAADETAKDVQISARALAVSLAPMWTPFRPTGLNWTYTRMGGTTEIGSESTLAMRLVNCGKGQASIPVIPGVTPALLVESSNQSGARCDVNQFFVEVDQRFDATFTDTFNAVATGGNLYALGKAADTGVFELNALYSFVFSDAMAVHWWAFRIGLKLGVGGGGGFGSFNTYGPFTDMTSAIHGMFGEEFVIGAAKVESSRGIMDY
jgi:hypothetical protein